MSKDELIEDISIMYRKRIGHELNIFNPKSYTEIIQWSKFFDLDPMRSLLSDKYEVRKWVSDQIGPKYLIPLLGVWESAQEIDFDALPNSFVLKTNNASGTNIVIKDKTKVNVKLIRKKLNKWLSIPFGLVNYEPQYLEIKPLIIAEKYISPERHESDLRDYKFLCFDGIPSYIWVDVNRNTEHARAVFDTSWNLQEWNQLDYPLAEGVEKPSCLDEMLAIAAQLSKGFPHVRVDLYEVSGAVYFGEMTFTNGGGFERIVPREYDELLGSMWHYQGSAS